MSDSLNQRGDLEGQVIEKALKDDAFRAKLIADPKATIEAEVGVTLPADLQIQVLQETPRQLYLVLPPAPAASTPISGSDVGSVADCSGWSSFAECTAECTQCGNNDTTCAPGPTEG